MKHLVALLIFASFSAPVFPLSKATIETYFENIELMEVDGENIRERSVRVVFQESSMSVISRSGGAVLKEWKYEDIKSAEYSYTKNPRWKTGMGLGAAGMLFPPLLLIAIPVGFTKHRRHWVTIRTEKDFAVLKVGKGVRKLFIPTFETRSSVVIQAMGDDK
jgi:hypothetical protein